MLDDCRRTASSVAFGARTGVMGRLGGRWLSLNDIDLEPHYGKHSCLPFVIPIFLCSLSFSTIRQSAVVELLNVHSRRRSYYQRFAL